MSQYRTIRLETDERGVARLILERPDKHNALDAEMIGELREAAEGLAGDGAVRVVVLQSAGKSFCAGADLNWMRDQMELDRAGKMAGSMELARMLDALDGLPKPTVARVHGAAYGGGIGMMSVCDVVIAAEGARFALTEARLGLIPATIGPYVVRRLGEGTARRMFFNARPFDAAEAKRYGLVSEVVAPQSLDAAVEAEIACFLDCAPGAVAAAKSLCRRLARTPHEDHRAWTAEQLAERWESEEAQQGIGAFFDRRKPPWMPEEG